MAVGADAARLDPSTKLPVIGIDTFTAKEEMRARARFKEPRGRADEAPVVLLRVEPRHQTDQGRIVTDSQFPAHGDARFAVRPEALQIEAVGDDGHFLRRIAERHVDVTRHGGAAEDAGG